MRYIYIDRAPWRLIITYKSSQKKERVAVNLSIHTPYVLFIDQGGSRGYCPA